MILCDGELKGEKMVASELVKELKKSIKNFGDLPVFVDDYGDESSCAFILHRIGRKADFQNEKVALPERFTICT